MPPLRVPTRPLYVYKHAPFTCTNMPSTCTNMPLYVYKHAPFYVYKHAPSTCTNIPLYVYKHTPLYVYQYALPLLVQICPFFNVPLILFNASYRDSAIVNQYYYHP